jgi:hypothetical protein
MSLKSRFLNDGYAVVTGIFPSDEVNQLKIAMEKLITKVKQEPLRYTTRYTFKQEPDYDTWGVNNIFKLDLYEPAFGDVFGNERLMDVLHEILGEELRFWGAHALWSPEKINYRLRWHRDYGDNELYHPEGIPNHVQFNIPLYPDSCFIAIPGSHRRALFDQERGKVNNNEANPLPNEVQITCQPGDVLFMNAHTLHRGACTSQDYRRTLHYSVQGKEEAYGGHTSYPEMKEKGYLDQMHPTVQQLMINSVLWDESHPLSSVDLLRKVRSRNERQNYIAGQV